MHVGRELRVHQSSPGSSYQQKGQCAKACAGEKARLLELLRVSVWPDPELGRGTETCTQEPGTAKKWGPSRGPRAPLRERQGRFYLRKTALAVGRR